MLFSLVHGDFGRLSTGNSFRSGRGSLIILSIIVSVSEDSRVCFTLWITLVFGTIRSGKPAYGLGETQVMIGGTLNSSAPEPKVQACVPFTEKKNSTLRGGSIRVIENRSPLSVLRLRSPLSCISCISSSPPIPSEIRSEPPRSIKSGL